MSEDRNEEFAARASKALSFWERRQLLRELAEDIQKRRAALLDELKKVDLSDPVPKRFKPIEEDFAELVAQRSQGWNPQVKKLDKEKDRKR